MSEIYYSAELYTGQYTSLNQPPAVPIQCNIADLVRCAITVGSPAIFPSILKRQFWPNTPVTDLLIKALFVIGNVKKSNGRLLLSRSFRSKPPSQKGIISADLGMAFAKFYSEKLFKIPNLICLEKLKGDGSQILTINKGSRSEPDLIGMTRNGDWHVFEAKGRSNFSQISQAVKKGKKQAKQILSINGISPTTRSVCATYFGEREIYSRLVDPDKYGKKKVAFDEDIFHQQYYSPFSKLNNEFQSKKKNINGDKYSVVSFSLKNKIISFGINCEIEESIVTSNYRGLKKSLREHQKKIENYNFVEGKSFGFDGFYVSIKNN